jgi:WD40 repeat protein
MAEDKVFNSETEVTSLAFSKDGKSLATSNREGEIRLIDLQSGSVTRSHKREEGDGNPIFLEARGQFAVIGKDGRVKLRNLDSGATIYSLAVSGPRVSRVATTLDGKTIAGGGPDAVSASGNLVRVWDADGTQHFQVPAGIGGLSAMTFSPDGQTLVASAYDTDMRVWNARNGELMKVVEDMTVSMFDLAYSPDGKQLAAAGVDRIIYLWDAKAWRLVRKITGQPEMISAMEFSPDGKFLVTGGMNEMAFGAPVKVIVWDVSTGKPVRTVDAEHRVNAATFSPDGRWFAAADSSKNVKLWAVR